MLRLITCVSLSAAIGFLVAPHSASGATLDNSAINLREFGARGDNLSDDTNAYNSAVDRINERLSDGASVRFLIPPGKYILRNARPIALPQSSSLEIEAEAGASLVEAEDRTPVIIREVARAHGGISRVIVHGLTVTRRNDTPESHITGDGIDILGLPQSQGGGKMRITASDLRCDGRFMACLKLENPVNATIRGFRSAMPGTFNADPTQGTGIWLYTTPDPARINASIDNHITDSVMTGGFAGIRIDNHSEGLQISAATIVGASYGLYAPADLRSNGASWISVSGSHFNTSVAGIYAENASNLNFTGNLFFALPPVAYGPNAQLPRDFGAFSAASPGWAGIWALNASSSAFNGNSFYGFLRPGQNSTGIRFSKMDDDKGRDVNAAETTTITGNVMEAMNNGPLQIDRSSLNIATTGNISIVTRSSFSDNANGPSITLANNMYNDHIDDMNTPVRTLLRTQNTPDRASDGNINLTGKDALVFGVGAHTRTSSIGASGSVLRVSTNSMQVTGGIQLIEGARFQGSIATPASSSSPCKPGEFEDDQNYHYVCVAPDKWRRSALSDF